MAPWGKLYKKNILGDILFPEGKKWEDLMTIPYVIENAGLIAYTNKTHYYWRMTPGSVTHSKITDKDLALFDALENYVDYFTNKYPQLRDAFICRYCSDGFNAVIHRLVFEKDYYNLIRPIRAKSIRYWEKGLSNPYVSRKVKIQVFLMLFGAAPYRVFWKIYHFVASKIFKIYG